MTSLRSDTFVVVPSVSRLTPEQKKESLFEAAKTGKIYFKVFLVLLVIIIVKDLP